MTRFRAAFEDDVRRVRDLQSDYDDTARILGELQDDLARVEDARDSLLDEIAEQQSELKRIDAELGRYSPDVIDAA